MEILIFIVGIIIGGVSVFIFTRRERIHGIINLDHKTEQCLINITSDELFNPKKKVAVFVINHNADLSQEKQTL